MRGVSALQRALRRHPDAAVRVLVVWEPVLVTDLSPPFSWVLSTVSDPRAVQFWDPRKALSAELSRAAEARPAGSFRAATRKIGSIFWDYIAFFPPGARWDSLPPEPGAWYFPVVHHQNEMEARLAESKTDSTSASVGIRDPIP